MTQYASGPVALDQPYYGASIGVAFTRFWKKYATFRGRASRSEYWWWALIEAIIGLVLGILAGIGYAVGGSIDSTTGMPLPGPLFFLFSAIISLWGLAVIVPSIALTVRRFHDANFSGLFLLLAFVPGLGGLIVLIFTLLPPNPQGARFD